MQSSDNQSAIPADQSTRTPVYTHLPALRHCLMRALQLTIDARENFSALRSRELTGREKEEGVCVCGQIERRAPKPCHGCQLKTNKSFIPDANLFAVVLN